MTVRSARRACAALLLALAAGGAAVAQTPPAPDRPSAGSGQAVANLEAFARLYGAARYFYPGDEAADADWGRVAVLGAERVAGAETPEDLERALRSVFGPLAPALRLFPAGGTPPPPGARPADGLDVVAWQHRGVWLGNPQNFYQSVRLGRPPTEPPPPFGAFVQAVDATPLQGRRVRLSAAVRAERGGGQLWLRVDRPDFAPAFFDNMDGRPVTSPEWATHTIEGPVADDAVGLMLGGLITGDGAASFDAFRLDVEGDGGDWTEVAVENGSFEAAGTPAGWMAESPGYTFAVAGGAAEGDRALRAASLAGGVAAALFDERPAPGEAAVVDLGRGLRASVPLALPSRDGRTLPAPDAGAFAALRAALDGVDLAPSRPAVRAADVVVAWTVFEHFYPYFDVVDVDWDAALGDALRGALAAETDAAHCRALRGLVARLVDGHGFVGCPSGPPVAPLPFAVERVEGQTVVVATADSSRFRLGDAVVSVDGADAGAALDSLAALASGSPQWRLRRAYREFGLGPPGSTARVVLDRDGRRVELDAPRMTGAAPAEGRPAPIAEVRPGVFYVDVERATDAQFEERRAEIAAADGVVFDFRGYPRELSPAFLAHLADRPVVSALWEVPQTVRPGDPGGAGHDTTRWAPIPPSDLRVRGRVAVLVDERAISYAESVLGIVDHYGLGTTVGGPTAGANGNVNPFGLPGGARVSWTGMRVRQHDGSRLHGVGIAPDVPVARTRAGVRAGRDEVLERAVEVVTGGR